ncbi:hypothetical protein VKT23_014384 [Stygiomarasmius scandens]|uniref:Mixed lineage kinase domain-containing protein n=1 Tax=Marasmiellus scandens TaxID=2682957 RepID=A0ABR1J0H8_9AGAR
MSFLSRSKPKAKGKDKDKIPSGFDFSHAKDILTTIASISKAASFPPLEGAAEVAKRIVEIAETAKKNKGDCASIAEDIVHLLEDIKGTIEQRGKGKVDEGLRRCIEELEQELQKIQQNLKGISQRNRTEKLFHATSDADIIKDCKDKIKHCIDAFNLKGTVNNWHTGTELQEGQAKLIQGQEFIQEGQAKLLQGQEVIHHSLARIANTHDQSEIIAE